MIYNDWPHLRYSVDVAKDKIFCEGESFAKIGLCHSRGGGNPV